MGSSDIAPPTAPVWLVDVSTACLGLGVFFWLIAYVFMVRRSLATGYTAVPIAALGVNLAWEAVWVAYVTDSRLELVGFAAWLLLDLPVVYSTLRTARRSFMRRSLVGSYPGITLASVFIVSAVVYALFARWWLAVPHRGFGDKTGKTWRGIEYRDTTELSWWTAGFAQALCSVTALTMLLSRGHSGGQGYKIWFFRFVGTQMGLPVTGGLLWWYWPEAHGFIFQPLSIVMIGASLACDLIYPFVLARVRATEHIFPNGTMLSGYAAAYIDRKRTRFGNPSPDVNGTSSPRRTRTGSILSKEQKAK